MGVCVHLCVCVDRVPLVSRFNNLLDRWACDAPLRDAANEEKGCLVVLCSDPTIPPCPPCQLPLITAHIATPHLNSPHPNTPSTSLLLPVVLVCQTEFLYFKPKLGC